ncbi:amidase domain-containing protein [Microbacterium gilvum]|uniref:IPT/TIG domain-containing protein n=1 Tax=Microbacterium gilvum TaxID=1336204 RepID=A0ABP9AR85_9MICO
MSDATPPRSTRAAARRAARRRARLRRAAILGGGALLIAGGAVALGVADDGADTAIRSAQAAPDTVDVRVSGSADDADEKAGDGASDGQAASADAEPHVDALSATEGSLVAGETVTISGAGLEGVTRVAFGDVDAQITRVADDAVDVVVPTAVDYVAGDVPVAVEADGAALAETSDLVYTYAVQTGVDAQLAYALAHWDDYNVAEFGNLNSIGGDCMNFASQTLLARGWTQNDEWYNDGTTSSEAWRYVPTFQTWMTENAATIGATELSLDERDQVKIGDLVVFDWDVSGVPDHIQVVSDVVRNADGSTTILMVGHNEDSDYRDLDEALTVDHPGGTAVFWSLPAA